MKKTLLATCAVALVVSLSACGGGEGSPKPAAVLAEDRYDAIWVAVDEAMAGATAESRPETPHDMDVAFGFDEDSAYRVEEFTITDDGTATRLCIGNAEQDVYLLNFEGLTYIGDGDCSTERKATALVVVDPGMGEIRKGADLVPTVAAKFPPKS